MLQLAHFITCSHFSFHESQGAMAGLAFSMLALTFAVGVALLVFVLKW